ncbi:hypothetical protein BH09MYX1_BH09MYX1_07620 [soil metagenome]
MTTTKKQKRCPDCEGPLTSTFESYNYVESGLSSVHVGPIEVRRCEACKSAMPVIPAIESLHRALAKMLVEQPSPLRGEEIRFLRKYLGFRGADFASVMGVQKETVSRWETGATPMGGASDRALRLLVNTNKPVASYEPSEFNAILAGIAERARKAAPKRELTRKHGGWEEATAAE